MIEKNKIQKTYLIFKMLQMHNHKIWCCFGHFITKSGVVLAILSQKLVLFSQRYSPAQLSFFPKIRYFMETHLLTPITIP